MIQCTDCDRKKETGGSHIFALSYSFCQVSVNKIAGSVSEKESDGLNQRHKGKGDTHGCRRLGTVKMADIDCIHHVVGARDQHADDRRYRYLWE